MKLSRALRWLQGGLPGAAERAYRDDERAYLTWKARNPGKRRSDYYAEIVSSDIAQKGASHPTLGATLHGTQFAESGKNELARLMAAGLKPGHVCVDYGCGSLRVGQHVIQYLEPGRYWGLDATDRFYSIGVDLIGTEVVEQKRPHLHVIDPNVLADVARARPDFIYSNAVVLHVPPEEIREFFGYVMGLFHPGTTALINVRLARTPRRISSRSWAYPESQLVSLVEELGGRVERVEKSQPQRSKHSWTRDVYPAWMVVHGSARS